MKKERLQRKFVSELRKIPIVQIACERCGITRQTAYRWRREDPLLYEQWDEAIDEGEALVNDMAESQLLQHIKEGDFPAVRYWLDRRHKKFKRPPDPEPTVEEKRQQRFAHLTTEQLEVLIEHGKNEIKKLEEERGEEKD